MKSRKVTLAVISLILAVVSLVGLYLLGTSLVQSVAATLRVESQVAEMERGIAGMQSALLEFSRAARAAALQPRHGSTTEAGALLEDFPGHLSPRLLVVSEVTDATSTGPLTVRYDELRRWASTRAIDSWHALPSGWHSTPILAYVLPSRSDAIHLYLVDPTVFLQGLNGIVAAVESRDGGNILLTTGDGQVLYSRRGTPGFVSQVLHATGHPGPDLSGVSFSIEDDYYVLSGSMALVDWTVVALVRRSTLDNEIARNRWIFSGLAGSCTHRPKTDTYSGRKRTVIPEQSGHLFRRKADTFSGAPE